MASDRADGPDDAEAIITAWMIDFLDHDRPIDEPLTAGDLIARLRRGGWDLNRSRDFVPYPVLSIGTSL